MWRLERGATVTPDGVRFEVWAPRARSVAVRVATERRHADHPLASDGDGVFSGEVRGLRAGARYRYVLDGARALPDPVSRSQPEGVHGPSAVVDPSAFRWTDAGWRGLAMPDYVIYELHVGTFTPEGTFDAAIAHLGELRALGVTAVEVMPVAEFPGPRNWGYDGVHLYAPQSSYGGPEGLRRFVDAAHRVGLAVVLDVVYNHVGPEGNYLDAFGPYFTERYRTPWGRAVNYDDAGSDEVRRFVVDNARYWVTEYHVDGLRLDAIHGIFDFSPTHVLREVADAVHAQARALGRQVVVIGESDLNDPRVVDARRYGWGLDAQWADDFHHAVHAFLTGERSGYYADYGGSEMIARALARPFVYAGERSPHRGRRHGAPAEGMPRWRFVVCLQNHDQVGNRATGERLSRLTTPERRKVATALLLLSGYVPLIFMGEEYGERNPFQYFVSHGDPDLVEAVRQGRRAEFASFGWGEEVPDPQSEETFARSRLERVAARSAEQTALRHLYEDLLRLRREEPALRPGDARVRVAHHAATDRIVLFLTPTTGQGRPLVAFFNLGADAQGFRVPGGAERRWRCLLSTTDARYGGPGAGVAHARGGTTITLLPHAAILLRDETPTSAHGARENV